MKRSLLLLLIIVFSITAVASERGPVFVVPLKSEVSEAQFFFLRRALKTAEREKASGFVIEMETYGGDAMAAVDNMQALLKSSVPTFTYVNSRAISAGALIAMATQKIYMSSTAVIGAAAPVASGGEDLSKTMSDKAVSTFSAVARAAAQKNGHNPDIAAAFIDKEREVKIGDVVIDRSDSLLTLSAEEAARVYNGKPLLAEGLADSLDEMLQKAGLAGLPIKRVEPSGFERLALWVTALAPLLLLGGIIGAFVEFKIPGFGLPGFVSIGCFSLFFAGHYIAGLAGWEAVVCFSLGLALVLGELLVHPGTIAPGIIGVLMIFGSLVYAMVDRWPGQPLWPTQEMLMVPLIKFSFALLTATIGAYLLAKYLPATSFYQHLVLADSVPAGPALISADAGRELAFLERGMTGIAHTTLRPSGKANFGDRLTDVISRGEFIEQGTPVRIVYMEGSRVTVEAASAHELS
ncbi:MAG: Membrane-bound serine protease [Chthoniobacteraceae bacterium]|nr:Membrane-bound serine protease [Chthoniobacteraceae bacterium]